MFTPGVTAAADVMAVEGVGGTVTTPPPSGTPLKSSFRPTRNQKGQSLQNVSLVSEVFLQVEVPAKSRIFTLTFTF